MNKRAIENLIKAGAMDGLGGTRKQFMSVYVQIADHIAHDKKNNLAGQISLFDIAGEEDKEEFDIRMPDVGEYNKEMLLGFEKEVLGCLRQRSSPGGISGAVAELAEHNYNGKDAEKPEYIPKLFLHHLAYLW
mgnify:CR=1 FL=1